MARHNFSFSKSDIAVIQAMMDGLDGIPFNGIELMHKTEDGARIRILKDVKGKYWLFDDAKHAQRVADPSDVAGMIRAF